MPKIISEYREEARRKILLAGLEVLYEKGYCNTTMDEIARRLGVSKPALYRYFKTKDELIIESTKENHTKYHTMIYEPDHERCPLESWLAIFEAVMVPDPGVQSLYFDIISMTYRREDLKAFSIQRMEEEITNTTRKITCWQERGQITSDRDPRTLAITVIALFNGMRLQIMLGVEREELFASWIENLKILFNFQNSDEIRSVCSSSCMWFDQCQRTENHRSHKTAVPESHK